MKVGFLITARLKSSRLPLKLMMDMRGKPLVERVIERAKKVSGVAEVVLCTSTNAQDRPLIDCALDQSIYYFLGSEEDVLARLLGAAQFFDMDYFVNITGENPLFSIEYANVIAEELRSGHYDFIQVSGLPVGCACYGLGVKALEIVCQIKKEVDTEIWGLLINRPDIYRVKEIHVEDIYQIGESRLTTDYIEDYLMLSRIFSYFDSDYCPSYLEVVQLLTNKPEILQLNAMRKQAAVDPAMAVRIDKFYEDNYDAIVKMTRGIR